MQATEATASHHNNLPQTGWPILQRLQQLARRNLVGHQQRRNAPAGDQQTQPTISRTNPVGHQQRRNAPAGDQQTQPTILLINIDERSVDQHTTTDQKLPLPLALPVVAGNGGNGQPPPTTYRKPAGQSSNACNSWQEETSWSPASRCYGRW